MALDTARVSDILMQPMEFFPISSCNSWALSGLPTLPSLQKMSIGVAGIRFMHPFYTGLHHMLHTGILHALLGGAARLQIPIDIDRQPSERD